MMLLAYMVFRDPLWRGWDYWYLFLIPLGFLIALIYKAMRCDDLAELPRQTTRSFLKLLGAFVGCAVALYVIVMFLER